MLSNQQLAHLIYNDIEKSVVLDEVRKGRNYQKNTEDQKRFRK